jgi:hypothetical protein
VGVEVVVVVVAAAPRRCAHSAAAVASSSFRLEVITLRRSNVHVLAVTTAFCTLILAAAPTAATKVFVFPPTYPSSSFVVPAVAADVAAAAKMLVNFMWSPSFFRAAWAAAARASASFTFRSLNLGLKG